MMTDPQTVVVHPAPLTGSERVRRTRERKRKDIVFLGIEILPTERNALIRSRSVLPTRGIMAAALIVHLLYRGEPQ
jgi:hypothetical protein